MRALLLVAMTMTMTTAVTACGSDLDSCKVVCAKDADCPNGQTCGDVGRCTSGELCAEGTCEASAFLGCADDETARTCDPDGTGATSDDCRGFGCNATAARCNECRPDQTACAGDDLTVCDSDGLIASAETCALSCNDAEARCFHIVPVWTPQICDEPAAELEKTIAGVTLDTGLDDICDTIIAQPEGPEICVIRGGTLTVGSVVVVGRRALALVADRALQLDGILDIAANRSASGPGGGGGSAGGSQLGGGGGAGGRQTGGNGGGFLTAGGAGGAIDDPLSSPVFRGGASGGGTSNGGNEIGEYQASGGGGGGAALLVSCAGTVTVAGQIQAGGGGGNPGGRVLPQQGSPFVAGAGGGAGGYVVIQGARVEITGSLFANGGGGGGGTSAGTGVSGKDGGAGGGGGSATGTAAAGGSGGKGIITPNPGVNATTNGQSGGGGGSTGRFQIYTPNGVTPILTPAITEPPFEPVLEVPKT